MIVRFVVMHPHPGGATPRRNAVHLGAPSRWGRARSAYQRDAAVTAGVFGYFAAVWFGWAQTQPPPTWRIPLLAGSALALATALVGGVLTWRYRRSGTALDAKASRTFGLIVAAELSLAVLGIPVLAGVHHPELRPAYVGFIVGLHLLPLGRLFKYPLLHLAGAAVTVLSVVAVPLARLSSTPLSAVAGAAAGTTLLAAAAASLSGSLTQDQTHDSPRPRGPDHT